MSVLVVLVAASMSGFIFGPNLSFGWSTLVSALRSFSEKQHVTTNIGYFEGAKASAAKPAKKSQPPGDNQ